MLINKRNLPMKIGVALSIITLTALLFILIKNKFSSQKISYVVFVDAGSSGSRLHVFKITEQDSPKKLPFIQDVSTGEDKIKPGISSFASHPDKVGITLQPLLDKAALQIKQQNGDISQTSFFLYATAGMRLLMPEQQKTIFDNIKITLLKYGFKNSILKIISGEKEGVFGWLAVNYLLDQAHYHAKTEKLQDIVYKKLDAPEYFSQGVLELGGASTQIAYYKNNSSNPNNIVSFVINKQKFTVFSHSFLGLGHDQARAKTNYPTHCYPAGFTILESGETSHAFNWDACRRALLPLLNNPPFEKNARSVAQIIQPLKNNIQYYAISGFSHVFNFFKAKTLAELKKNSQLFCSSWTKLKEYDGHDKTSDVF